MKHKQQNMRVAIAIILGVFLCLSASACANTSKSKDTAATKSTNTKSKGDGKIHIKYVGDSCFNITFADGTRLVIDPYGSEYATSFAPFPDLTADLVTITSSYADHNKGLSEVKGNPKVIQPEDLKPTKIGDIEISGYTSKHVAGGDNTIFVYKEGNFKIVHMGETDNIDSPEAKAAVKDADVLLVYAGEYSTVKNKESFVNLSALNIKVMIPQHYSMDPKMPWYGEPSIDKIITELPAGTKVTKSKEFIVTKDMEKQFVAMTP